jgi:virulence-associated protein VagC
VPLRFSILGHSEALPEIVPDTSLDFLSLILYTIVKRKALCSLPLKPEVIIMQKKPSRKVNISPKRQITIPKDFYDRMEISNNKVQVYLDGKRMIVEPITEEDDLFDFTEQIKARLEKEGYQGKELTKKLVLQKKVVEQAFVKMIKEAEEEYHTGKTVSHEDLFADSYGSE